VQNSVKHTADEWGKKHKKSTHPTYTKNGLQGNPRLDGKMMYRMIEESLELLTGDKYGGEQIVEPQKKNKMKLMSTTDLQK